MGGPLTATQILGFEIEQHIAVKYQHEHTPTCANTNSSFFSHPMWPEWINMG